MHHALRCVCCTTTIATLWSRTLLSLSSSALLVTGLTGTAAAAEEISFVPATTVCSGDYACMSVNRTQAPAGATVTFTGKLSTEARKALDSWTRGTNIVCLDRYKTTTEKDGSWPWTPMEGACSPVRKNGQFTIQAEFGRVGTFIYGVEFGPCRSNADECGAADSGLVGGIGDGDKALVVTTTPVSRSGAAAAVERAAVRTFSDSSNTVTGISGIKVSGRWASAFVDVARLIDGKPNTEMGIEVTAVFRKVDGSWVRQDRSKVCGTPGSNVNKYPSDAKVPKVIYESGCTSN